MPRNAFAQISKITNYSGMAVYLALLGKEIVLLEGIRLSEVPDGVYFLNCAPLNLSDTDGAPCRALLFDIP